MNTISSIVNFLNRMMFEVLCNLAPQLFPVHQQLDCTNFYLYTLLLCHVTSSVWVSRALPITMAVLWSFWLLCNTGVSKIGLNFLGLRKHQQSIPIWILVCIIFTFCKWFAFKVLWYQAYYLNVHNIQVSYIQTLLQICTICTAI